MKKNRLVHPGFWFGKTNFEDALELSRLGAGGFCIYGGTAPEVKLLTASLRAASPHKQILISADYEDGLGRWLPDAALLPTNLAIGASDSKQLAFEKGKLTALQARSLGVDWVFAPVLDLADTPGNPIVNTRAFSDDPRLVTALGGALMEGLCSGGILNSVKHFPGHGATDTDSHLALPILKRSLEQLQSHELIPFKELLNKTDAVMIGHLLLPQVDDALPASQSKKIITGLLKENLGWNGCVITDALCMKAIGDEKEASRNALLAGAHILLSCEKPFELMDYLNSLPDLDALTANALAQQDQLIARLQARQPPATSVNLMDDSFAQQAAPYCLMQQGSVEPLAIGETVHYLELGNEESYLAKDFLYTLQKNGIRIVPFKERANKLIAVSFSNYKAFKGHINLSAEEHSRLKNALAASKNSTLISFGSPFCFKGLEKQATAALFTFSPTPAFQRAAAALLIGRGQALGKMPVQLPD